VGEYAKLSFHFFSLSLSLSSSLVWPLPLLLLYASFMQALSNDLKRI